MSIPTPTTTITQNVLIHPNVLNSLQSLLADRCTTDPTTLQSYTQDYSYHPPQPPPQVLVFPKTEEEVIKIVKICDLHSIPIIPYGSGTSLEGQTTTPTGGICMNFKEMDKIICVHEKDMDVVVQPGVSFVQLNHHLEKFGFYFPLDAGPGATIGGMASTSASGTRAVRYGTMKENVLSLRVVLGDGTALKTANRARKSVSGYDLTHLFVGSEGTLGIITEIIIRIFRIPEFGISALIPFHEIQDASHAVMEMMYHDAKFGMVELMDDVMMDAINRKFKLTLGVQPTLILEFSGNAAEMEGQRRVAEEICQKYRGGPFSFVTKKEEREKIFQIRKSALFASTILKPGAEVWTTDVCVPISNLAKCISETKKDIQQSTLIAPLVGHVGDGNFHLFILLDPKNRSDFEKAKKLNESLVVRAIMMEGTCTGEHGVGLGKRGYLEMELGIEAVKLMKRIKIALDPKNIMNPGKKIVIERASL